MDWGHAVAVGVGVLAGVVVSLMTARVRPSPVPSFIEPFVMARPRSVFLSRLRPRYPSGPRRVAVPTPSIEGQPEPMPPNFAQSSLNALKVGVLVLDQADRPALANPAARAMGLVSADPERHGGAIAHTVVRKLADGVRRSGITREVEMSLPRSSGSGEPLGVQVRAVDIGGGYIAIEAADTTEAHRVARVRRDFVANVSHELKTPVGALQLLGEALQEAVGDVADVNAVRRFSERIRHESARLGRLITDLLELSRLQGGEPLPEPEPVSVDRIIAEVVDRSRTTAAAKGIEVVVGGERGLTAYGNESQLVTAVANLVDNAVAYSPEDTQVEIVSVTSPGGLQLIVRDEGIGIEARDLDRIFERFYRADRARSRATGGTGLGLAIVKHVATNHGGRVDVVSTVGEGSTFTLRLPARPTDVAETQSSSTRIEFD